MPPALLMMLIVIAISMSGFTCCHLWLFHVWFQAIWYSLHAAAIDSILLWWAAMVDSSLQTKKEHPLVWNDGRLRLR